MATTDKYDRQLRLWGASGQRALAETLIVLVGGSSAAGTETIKNLVLPGVGGFVIVEEDDRDDDDDGNGGDGRVLLNGGDGDAPMGDGDSDDDGGSGEAMDVVDPPPSSSSSSSSAFDIRPCPKASLDDSGAVKFSSFSSNFFLPPPSPTITGSASSSSAAARACASLSELNPDARGYHLTPRGPLESLDYAALLDRLSRDPLPSGECQSGSGSAAGVPAPAPLRKLLVVCADQPSPVSLSVSRACHERRVPLVLVRSYGLLGWVRVQTAPPYHRIVESKPANRPPDLRLSRWPVFEGLGEVAGRFGDLGKCEEDGGMDDRDHGRVPYVAILLQALENWRAKLPPPPTTSSSPRFPKTYAEKNEFRTTIRGLARNIHDQKNFEEALGQAHAVWADGRVSDTVREVLDRASEELLLQNAAAEPNADRRDASSPPVPASLLQFQLLCCALKRYLDNNDGYPPLEGTIPDMTSDTASYVALQEAYRKRADDDRVEFAKHAEDLYEECAEKAMAKKAAKKANGGTDDNEGGGGPGVPMPNDEEIATFCKNARCLRLLETRPFHEEYRRQDPSRATPTPDETPSPVTEDLFSDARDDLLASTMDPYESDPIQTPLLWWIALRACDAFRDRNGRYPGNDDRALSQLSDASEVKNLAEEICAALGLTRENCDLVKTTLLDGERGMDIAREAVRYDDAEVHGVSAIVGGVASQEAVKLIAGQYVPLDDTYVYNGIASTAGVYRF